MSFDRRGWFLGFLGLGLLVACSRTYYGEEGWDEDWDDTEWDSDAGIKPGNRGGSGGQAGVSRTTGGQTLWGVGGVSVFYSGSATWVLTGGQTIQLSDGGRRASGGRTRGFGGWRATTGGYQAAGRWIWDVGGSRFTVGGRPNLGGRPSTGGYHSGGRTRVLPTVGGYSTSGGYTSGGRRRRGSGGSSYASGGYSSGGKTRVRPSGGYSSYYTGGYQTGGGSPYYSWGGSGPFYSTGGSSSSIGGATGTGGAGLMDCVVCARDECAEPFQACLSNPLCAPGIGCTLSSCPSADLRCALACFQGDLSAVAVAAATMNCVVTACGSQCLGVLPRASAP